MAGLAALAVGAIGFASAAGATGRPRLPARPLTIDAASASNYLAGYRLAPSGGLASASVTFTIPTISCPGTDPSKGALQYDGVYTDTLATYALVLTECTTSGIVYDYLVSTNAGYLLKPGAAPGDTVVASLFQSASSTYAEVHDLTKNVHWFAGNSLNQGDTTVDVGTLNPAYEGLPVATYTKAKFFNATVNGDYLGFDAPTEYNALNGGDLLVKTSALLTTGTGSSFHTTFKKAT
jgi:hypothetical protein